MPRTDDSLLSPERLQELAARAAKVHFAVFSPFLTPPEMQLAANAAQKQGVYLSFFGGYEGAERQMAQFSSYQSFEGFPVAALQATWPRQPAPSHRDLLGSVMGLGIQRHVLGDIVLLQEKAYLFVQSHMAQHLLDGWTQAGNVRLQTELQEGCPDLPRPEGQERRDTVASLRLDALVASGLRLSRGKAVELIETGHVKLRYIPVLRCDSHVECGDMISVRGKGRLQLAQVGNPTRKGRIPIVWIHFGDLAGK